jgi:hypothetical protein
MCLNIMTHVAHFTICDDLLCVLWWLMRLLMWFYVHIGKHSSSFKSCERLALIWPMRVLPWTW